MELKTITLPATSNRILSGMLSRNVLGEGRPLLTPVNEDDVAAAEIRALLQMSDSGGILDIVDFQKAAIPLIT